MTEMIEYWRSEYPQTLGGACVDRAINDIRRHAARLYDEGAVNLFQRRNADKSLSYLMQRRAAIAPPHEHGRLMLVQQVIVGGK